MKAVRRHQLKDNELAKQLETFPEMLKRNANKIMLGITAVLLIVFFVRYRMAAAEARRLELSNAMMTVRQGPRALRFYDSQPMPPETLMVYRGSAIEETTKAIDTVLRDAAEGEEGAPLRGEALVARGDLNWSLANLSPIKEAATQPSMRPARSADEYLRSAEEAYREVVNNYANYPIAWVSAQFGLAAIAENRRDWDSARQAYAAIADSKAAPTPFQQTARQRIAILPQIQGPLLLSSYPASAPSTAPATLPSMLSAPATSPTTSP